MGVERIVLLYGVGGALQYGPVHLCSQEYARCAARAHPDHVSVFYFSVAASLAQTDSLEEAAYGLGASKVQTWTRVLLPMLTPAMVAGALLTFMSSMASYTAPLLFGVDTLIRKLVLDVRRGAIANRG